MNPSPRDRISVDLQGLKVELTARAQAAGISPSRLVRDLLAAAMGQKPTDSVEPAPSELAPAGRSRIRIWLRMSRQEGDALFQAAQHAGLSPGEFVAGLVAAVPVLQQEASRPEFLRLLSTSCAEISTLSRNIRHLTALLRDGEFRPAQEYRPMLDTLDADVRRHLTLASEVLSDLLPRRGGTRDGRDQCALS